MRACFSQGALAHHSPAPAKRSARQRARRAWITDALRLRCTRCYPSVLGTPLGCANPPPKTPRSHPIYYFPQCILFWGARAAQRPSHPNPLGLGCEGHQDFVFAREKKNSLFQYGNLDSSLLIPSIWRLQGAARTWVRARLLPPRISPRELCTSPPCFECVI